MGRSYALLLAAQGAKVVVNDPGGSLSGAGADETTPAEDVVGEIIAAGGEAVANTDSVATPEGGQAIIGTALDRYGRIDILIHNAGNVRRSPLREMSYEDFEAVVDVHLRGAFHVVRPAFPAMCDADYGRIVLTSSIGGLYGNHGVANYAVAKAGVIGLSNVAAMEGVDHGIRSNVIVPAAVTRMAEGIDTSAYPRWVRSWWRPSSDGWRTRHVRSQGKYSSRSRAGGDGRRRGDSGCVPAVVDDSRRRREHDGDPRRHRTAGVPRGTRRPR